jgi:hypothetical protein
MSTTIEEALWERKVSDAISLCEKDGMVYTSCILNRHVNSEKEEIESIMTKQDVLVIPLINGICNRLLPLLSLSYIARESDRKILAYWQARPGRISIIYYGDTTEFSELFTFPGITFITNDTLCMLNRKMPVLDVFRTPPIVEKGSVCFVNAWGVLFPDWFPRENLGRYNLHSGKFIQDDYFKILRKEAKKLLPVSSIQKIIEEEKRKIKPSKIIGLHLRRTDGGFLTKNWDKTDEELLKRVEEWREKGYSFFVASDHEKYEDYFGEVYLYRTENKYGNTKTNTKAGIVDLYLLAECDIIISTQNSSFGLVASLLSDKAELWYVSDDPITVKNITI